MNQSFSSTVKDELMSHFTKSRHCQVAELSALVALSSVIFTEENKKNLKSNIRNSQTFFRIFTLLKKTLNITEVDEILDHYDEIFSMTRLSDNPLCPDGLVIHQTCCKRAFIRGSFIAAGSMSDPSKSYHFEVVCDSEAFAKLLMHAMEVFELEPKMVERKEKFVVYLKEGGQIVEVLRVMEATKSVMEIENVRIVKEVRNTINRKVNCETANINKTVNAAVTQVDQIRLIENRIGIDALPDNLQLMARLRLENPEASLKELGAMFDPPLGKSGVNHRLARIAQIAESLL